MASNQTSPDHDGATISERTVIALERRSGDPAKWTHPRPSTVKALASVFGLNQPSAEYAEFVQAAEQLSAPPASSPAPRRITPRPPEQRLFVPDGREPHLAHLRQAVDNAAAGVPGVVFVSADPGVGKTSLLKEACRLAINDHDDLVVLWGDCTGRSGAADPHQPFRQALGMLIGDISAAGPQQSISDENERRIRIRMAVALASLIDDGRGLIDRFISSEAIEAQCASEALEPAIANALLNQLHAGLRPSSLGPNEQCFRLLARYAGEGPLILVLEDLHWADIGSASLLFHLMRRLHEQRLPVLVVGSFRPGNLESAQPGDRHPFPAVLNEAPRLFDDSLLDLSTAVGGDAGRAFVDAVVTHTIDQAPSSLSESLFEQTAGLPLFVLGMLRWYQAAGILREDAEGRRSYRWSPDPGNLPTEIDALFADLIDRLPHDLQALLDAASVQGNTFSADVVMKVAGLTRLTLIEMLDNQLTRRFRTVGHGGVATIAGQPSHEYFFEHALLRDYVYHRMTDLERTHYHASTAEAMLALYGPGQHNGAGRIAYHFDRAGDRVRAAHAYFKAGDYEMDHQEYAQARRFFGRIGDLDLRERDPFSVAQALVGLGNCARGDGENDLAARQFERAREIARDEGLLLVEANSLTSMGMLDFDAGRMRDGANRLSEAIEVLIELGDLDEACRSLALLSHTLHGMGNYDEAAVAAHRAIAMARDLHNDMFLVGGQIALANCWIDIGLFADAIAMYERGILICEEHGNLHRAAICWLNIALCEFEQGHWERSTAALKPVFDERDKINGRLIGAAEFNAGVVADEQGDHAEADRHYQASLDIRVENGQAALIIDSLAGLLRGAIAMEDTVRMRELLFDINARTREQGFDGVEHTGRLFVTLVKAWELLGSPDCARFYLRQGIDFINDRADRLADPAHRESYLTDVPAHRRLLELASSQSPST